MSDKKFDESEGVWRTVGGRRIFIRFGQSLSDAMIESGKFPNSKKVTSEYDDILTADEKGAIVRYIGPDSYKINEKLRNGTELYDFEKQWMKNLDTALDKMPSYEGKVFRSIYFEKDEDYQKFFDDHEVNKEKNYLSYISTSAGKCYNEKAKLEIGITSKTGKDIRNFNPDENEVLYPRNKIFLVKWKGISQDKYYIMLEEKENESES